MMMMMTMTMTMMMMMMTLGVCQESKPQEGQEASESSEAKGVTTLDGSC
jgi:ABC-type Zn uptake system ZnuABC Zn-binding protein ZnuA